MACCCRGGGRAGAASAVSCGGRALLPPAAPPGRARRGPRDGGGRRGGALARKGRAGPPVTVAGNSRELPPLTSAPERCYATGPARVSPNKDCGVRRVKEVGKGQRMSQQRPSVSAPASSLASSLQKDFAGSLGPEYKLVGKK